MNMKNARRLFLLLLPCTVLAGCLSGSRTGAWTNLHAGDPELAVIRIQQYPDCLLERDRYVGKHPAMILYIFEDGRVHQTGFEPDGTMHEDFWFTTGPHDPLRETAHPSVSETSG